MGLMVIHSPIPKTKFKHFECQAEFNGEWWHYFDFNLGWSRNVDHAGFNFSVNLMKLYFHFVIYDTRHAEDI